MSEIPEDVNARAKAITVDIFENCYLSRSVQGRVEDIVVAALLAERLSATEIERERWKPAATYFERYCQDEAEDVEDCVCGMEQHEDAKAFAAAIRSQP